MTLLHVPAKMDDWGILGLRDGAIPATLFVHQDCLSAPEIMELVFGSRAFQGNILHRYNTHLTDALVRAGLSDVTAWTSCLPRLWDRAAQVTQETPETGYSVNPMVIGMSLNAFDETVYTGNFSIVKPDARFALVVEHQLGSHRSRAEEPRVTGPRAFLFDRWADQFPGEGVQAPKVGLTDHEPDTMMSRHVAARPLAICAEKAIQRFITQAPAAVL